MIPEQRTPLPPNCTIPITEEQRVFYRYLKAHYELRIKANPGVLWLKAHLRYIDNVLKTNQIGSFCPE